MDMLSQLEQLKPRIVGLCRQIWDGEDLYQATWLRCLESYSAENWATDQTGRVINIAKNLRCDRERRRDTELRHWPSLSAIRESVQCREECVDRAMAQESCSVVKDALAELPERYQRVIEATFAIPGTPKFHAAHLGINPATLRTRKKRGMELLAKRLASRCL